MALPPLNPMKFVTMAAAPLVKAVRAQVALQDADSKAIRLGGVDAEINAALDVLALNAPTAGRALLQYAKGKISNRPDVFDEDPVPQWLATERTRGLVRAAVYAFIADEPVQQFADEAAAFFAEFDGADGPGRGYAAFEYTLPYALLGIAASLDTGDRLILDAVRGVADSLEAARVPVPVPLIDAEIEGQLDRIRRWRFFTGTDIRAAANRLGARIDGGELSRASDPVRAAALATCARYLARSEDRAGAERLLTASTAIADTEEAVLARAALLALDDVDAGLAHLAPIANEGRRLAALGIVAGRNDAAAMVDWAEAVGIDRTQVDSDGRHVLLASRIQAGRWQDAFDDADALTAEDLARTPALGHVAAMAHVARVTPPDLRRIVPTAPPFDPAGFPLADTPAALESRRLAAHLSGEAADVAVELGADEAANLMASFSLWLELRDPTLRIAARVRLATLLNGANAVQWIPLAIAFGVATDLAAVERAVSRAAALEPGGSVAIGLAHLSIALTRPTAAEAADHMVGNRDAILRHLDPAEVRSIEIGLLIDAGRARDAEARLGEAEGVLDDARITQLRARIGQGAGGAAIVLMEEAYAVDSSTANLAQLVAALSAQGYSTRFYQLARLLVATTRAATTAENAVRILLHAGRWDEVAFLLDDAAELVGQSRTLRHARAWSAFMLGDVRTASTFVEGLRAEGDDASMRSLHVNVLLASGRWLDLARHVDEEWAARGDRDAGELLDLAQLAGQVRPERVGDLITLAAGNAPADPHVLARSYLLGTQAGLDDGPLLHGWLERAAALSGDDGPIQRADLADLVAGQPDWNDRVSDVMAKLRAGVLPLFAAAVALRRPSLELRLGAMVGNQRESDPRRRSAMPAFSGQRSLPDLTATTLGLDGSSLVTLGVLGLIGTVVARGSVVIPHGTLGWLFRERQRLAFHQPSRIAFAHRLQRELGTGRMFRFASTATVDGRLADVIGRSLAAMIATAVARPDGASQRLVVRSSPVERIGSFSGEVIDLAAHSGVLCSCQRVVDALVARGQLTAAQERHARTYLEVNERRWSDEPEIADGADLYLDDLSVSYLEAAGVLGVVAAAGFRVHLPEREAEEVNSFLELEARSADIERVIEHVRAELAQGIEDGSVTLSAAAEEEEIGQHPDLRVVDLAGRVEAIVSDDRFVNKVRRINGPVGLSPVWTSLDVLALLHAEDRISDDCLTVHRTTLRRSGLVLFPTDAEELVALLAGTTLRDGEMVETGELRALRENLQLAQMRRFLTLPDEAAFLQSLALSAVAAILRQWTAAIPDDVARARSRWLLARADLRDWAAPMVPGGGGGLAETGLTIPLTTLLTHRLDAEASARLRFDVWLEEDVLQPLRYTDPRMHEWLMRNTREMILAIGEPAADD